LAKPAPERAQEKHHRLVLGAGQNKCLVAPLLPGNDVGGVRQRRKANHSAIVDRIYYGYKLMSPVCWSTSFPSMGKE
jgi:hypothetical protein